MENPLPRYPTTELDQSRPATTTADSDFTLTIDDALARYEAAGHPRTPRSVQRYCAKGHLECRLIETSFGEKWLITPASVDKHIAYIEEVSPSTGRGMSRQAAASSDTEEAGEIGKRPAPTRIDDQRQVATTEPIIAGELGRTVRATSDDTSRPVATAEPDVSRLVARLEGDIDFLRNQISVKDGQIKDLTERARETNVLIGGLQRMLSPLLGNGRDRESRAPFDAVEQGSEPPRRQ